MNSEPDWNFYRTFLAVLQAGSLSRAARMLGLTQPTVTRHIDQLEKAMGVALFLRTQRGLKPTDMGLTLVPYARSIAATAASLLRMASENPREVCGCVRVSASEGMGVLHLPSIFTALRRQFPALAIELVLSNAVADLLLGEADIAVRMTEPVQDVLIAQRLPSVEIGLYAHREYLQLRGVPSTMADLADHDMIGFDTETPQLRAIARQFQAFERSAFAFRTDSYVANMRLSGPASA